MRYIVLLSATFFSSCSFFNFNKQLSYCNDAFIKQGVIQSVERNISSSFGVESVSVAMASPQTLGAGNGEQTCEADMIVSIKKVQYKAKSSLVIGNKGNFNVDEKKNTNNTKNIDIENDIDLDK
jgi:hypothetical protein